MLSQKLKTTIMVNNLPCAIIMLSILFHIRSASPRRSLLLLKWRGKFGLPMNEVCSLSKDSDNPALPCLCSQAWVSWLNISILLGTLALALFNASRDKIATNFAIFYAVVSIAVLVCQCHFPLDYMAYLRLKDICICSLSTSNYYDPAS